MGALGVQTVAPNSMRAELKSPVRLVREDFFRANPEVLPHFAQSGIRSQAIEAAKDARDVAVENWGAGVKGNGSDGAGGVLPDSGQSLQFRYGLGDGSREIGSDFSSGRQQVAGPRVIPQSLPEAEDLLLVRRRESGDGGVSFHKRIIVRDNCRYLRLLEHEFADENRKGVAGPPPGQIAAVFVVPGEELFAESRSIEAS